MKIEVCKAGEFTAMNGQQVNITLDDLKNVAAAYDRSKGSAPLVIGHPKTDEPAFGWVERLSVEGDTLNAEFSQVEDGIRDLVRRGRYKRISAAFFMAEAPGNPVPGGMYLKHVGLLGAASPAVTGMKDAEFAGAEDKIAAFSMPLKDNSAERELLRLKTDNAVEKLISQGRVLPLHKPDIVEFMATLDDGDTLSFSSGESSPREWFLRYLSQQPQHFALGQMDLGKGTEDVANTQSSGGFNLPAGHRAAPEDMELVGRIQEYMRQHRVDFSTAAIAVAARK